MTDVSGRSQKQSVRVSAMMRFTEMTKIDKWFIDKIAHLVEVELQMKRSALDEDLLREAKRMEFPDNVIAEIDRTH